MGRTVDRHWDSRTYTSRAAESSDATEEGDSHGAVDSRTYTSRAAESSDPPRAVFRAYVPHPINGWAPDLNAALWHQVSASTERCRELRLSTAAGSLPAGWLPERAESIASSTIEGIRPSARRVARAEVQLSLFGERPPDDDMQTLRNIEVTRHARDLAAGGSDLTLESLRGLHATLMAVSRARAKPSTAAFRRCATPRPSAAGGAPTLVRRRAGLPELSLPSWNPQARYREWQLRQARKKFEVYMRDRDKRNGPRVQ